MCFWKCYRQQNKKLTCFWNVLWHQMRRFSHGFVRSWLSCWKRRSSVAFLCWYLQTSRTCWQLRQPPRSQRVSTCTPSATVSGRSSRALPSQGRASRCVSSYCSHPSLSRPGFYVQPSRVEVKRVHLINCTAYVHRATRVLAIYSVIFFFRRAWIGSARASTPRRSN